MAAAPDVDLVALSLLPLNWRRHIAQELDAGRPPSALLEDLLTNRALPPWLAVGGVPGVRRRAADTVRAAAAVGLGTVVRGDASFPPALSAIVDPPPVLWVRGCPDLFARPAVAVVGSRAASPYGLTVAARLAGDLAARGVAVVSGLARGIDSAAHRGALGGAGGTIAVLGSGADVVYPAEHAALAGEIAAGGAVISELAPGTRPHRRFFPMRNRIISGLSLAVVVVEAGEKSGSLITARCALDQGRDVMAVPGNVLSGRNRGGHALIRDGAKIVETVDDILEELAPGLVHPAAPAPASKGVADRTADPVLNSLPPGETCDLDVISARSGVPVGDLLTRLLALELQGRVARAGGGRFVRS